ncbi:MAG: hypothetical protein JWO54_363 [Candidatus Saccharibacteria bacterium]|nr:hypothetical protein [Candidatus Saccharibacteria bacterium]
MFNDVSDWIIMRVLNKTPLIISIKEMRKYLGTDAAAMSDEDVENLIMTLTEASSILLSQRTGSKG